MGDEEYQNWLNSLSPEQRTYFEQNYLNGQTANLGNAPMPTNTGDAGNDQNNQFVQAPNQLVQGLTNTLNQEDMTFQNDGSQVGDLTSNILKAAQGNALGNAPGQTTDITNLTDALGGTTAGIEGAAGLEAIEGLSAVTEGAAATAGAPGLSAVTGAANLVDTSVSGPSGLSSLDASTKQDEMGGMGIAKEALSAGVGTGDPVVGTILALGTVAKHVIENKSKRRQNERVDQQQLFENRQAEKSYSTYADPTSVWYRGDKGYYG